MSRMIDIEDLIDAHEVARVLGLSHRHTVSLYQRRYSDMPRPVVDLGAGRCKMWLRSEIIAWNRTRAVKAPGDGTEGGSR